MFTSMVGQFQEALKCLNFRRNRRRSVVEEEWRESNDPRIFSLLVQQCVVQKRRESSPQVSFLD